MNGVLSVFRSFDSWTAKMSILELIRRSRSSINLGRIPSAFHWKMFSLFCEVGGRGCEGDELVDPGSWQSVDSDVWFCWSLLHLSHFQWLSRVEALGSVLHFWWNPFEHTLHLTGTGLECKAAEHLAHFSLEIAASVRVKLGPRKTSMIAVWDVEVRCQVVLLNLNLLTMRNVDGSAKLEWKECGLLWVFWD